MSNKSVTAYMKGKPVQTVAGMNINPLFSKLINLPKGGVLEVNGHKITFNSAQGARLLHRIKQLASKSQAEKADFNTRFDIGSNNVAFKGTFPSAPLFLKSDTAVAEALMSEIGNLAQFDASPANLTKELVGTFGTSTQASQMVRHAYTDLKSGLTHDGKSLCLGFSVYVIMMYCLHVVHAGKLTSQKTAVEANLTKNDGSAVDLSYTRQVISTSDANTLPRHYRHFLSAGAFRGAGEKGKLYSFTSVDRRIVKKSDTTFTPEHSMVSAHSSLLFPGGRSINSNLSAALRSFKHMTAPVSVSHINKAASNKRIAFALSTVATSAGKARSIVIRTYNNVDQAEVKSITSEVIANTRINKLYISSSILGHISKAKSVDAVNALLNLVYRKVHTGANAGINAGLLGTQKSKYAPIKPPKSTVSVASTSTESRLPPGSLEDNPSPLNPAGTFLDQ